LNEKNNRLEDKIERLDNELHEVKLKN